MPTKVILIETKAQYILYEGENRAAELAIINKRKPKDNGYYCKITKYFPDYMPDSTKILIRKGKKEENVIRHFVEKRKLFYSYSNSILPTTV
jgi:hypothetical protein